MPSTKTARRIWRCTNERIRERSVHVLHTLVLLTQPGGIHSVELLGRVFGPRFVRWNRGKSAQKRKRSVFKKNMGRIMEDLRSIGVEPLFHRHGKELNHWSAEVPLLRGPSEPLTMPWQRMIWMCHLSGRITVEGFCKRVMVPEKIVLEDMDAIQMVGDGLPHEYLDAYELEGRLVVTGPNPFRRRT